MCSRHRYAGSPLRRSASGCSDSSSEYTPSAARFRMTGSSSPNSRSSRYRRSRSCCPDGYGSGPGHVRFHAASSRSRMCPPTYRCSRSSGRPRHRRARRRQVRPGGARFAALGEPDIPRDGCAVRDFGKCDVRDIRPVIQGGARGVLLVGAEFTETAGRFGVSRNIDRARRAEAEGHLGARASGSSG